jgi:hypothetical protein
LQDEGGRVSSQELHGDDLSNIVFFPTFNAGVPSKTAAAEKWEALNRRRIHLYSPTEQEQAHRSLDMAAQVGLAVARVQAEVERSITAERESRRTRAVKASMSAAELTVQLHGGV